MTLNRPERLNALDGILLRELTHALDDGREDDQVKALVITGAGRAFCSGADLGPSIRGTDPKQPGINRPVRLEPFVGFGAMVERLRRFHKPLIAAVNGIASGGGLSIVCLCDIRIASEKAAFSAIFVRRGLVADTGSSYFLPRIVGTQAALELMWTGDMIDAREAKDMGLVRKVVPHEALLPTSRELALKIARGPSTAIELMKRMVYEGLEANRYGLQAAYEAWAQEMCYLTEDYVEGIRSFKEKRPPVFTGR